MAAPKKVHELHEGGVVQVIRSGKTSEYEVADKKTAHCLVNDGTVLCINCADGREVYWLLEKITCWIVK